MREGGNNMWRGETKQGLRGQIKGRQAKEENKRLRRELKGADNAKEQHKFIGENKK